MGRRDTITTFSKVGSDCDYLVWRNEVRKENEEGRNGEGKGGMGREGN